LYLSLHPYFGRTSRDGNPASRELLPHVLKSFVSKFGSGFSIFADCGAGIGDTTVEYGEIIPPGGRVFTYEPLPENLRVLEKRFEANERICLRPVAVSDVNGEAYFSVPSRLQSNMGAWTQGTSYNGYLSESTDDSPARDLGPEQIAVRTVRLQDEESERFDFIKLDLQGGEHKAVLGLGPKLKHTKLLYVEHQLLKKEQSVTLLRDRGFLPFFDKLQFGFLGNVVPVAALERLGIATESVWTNFGNGDESVCFGHFNKTAELIDRDTLSLRPEIAAELRQLGAQYVQTDVLAVHPGVASAFFDVVGRY
jgi:FkbM family methyltransferase